jgi:hypothetical protein
MRLRTVTIFSASLLAVLVALAVAEQAAPAAARIAGAKAAPKSIAEVAYLLTWDKDPRYRGRDPFTTVLHLVGGPTTAKRVERLALPRTPGEETAFADKAEAVLKEAQTALDEGDFAAAEEKIKTAREMVGVPVTTLSAKERLVALSKALAGVEDQFGKVRARAALVQALQLAARMQGYFESERFGEVIGTGDEIEKLNNENGLKNAEVAQTAAAVLEKCAELKRRAEVRMEFAKQELKVDAVSFFPEGRSFAIINGEVVGEGAVVAPELTLAAVSGGNVTFEYKGEKISQGLAAPEASHTEGKAARRVR